MHKLMILSLMISAPAFAGSDSLDCTSLDRTVQMGAGNSEHHGIKIQFVGEDGKNGVFQAPVNILPGYDYDTSDEKAISAIPVSAQTNVKKIHKVMKITKKSSGEVCYGRQSWDDTYTQTYVLTAKSGGTLRRYDMLHGKKVRGMIEDGYIVTAFRCHNYGVSSPGGCRAESDDDQMEWVDEKDVPGEK